MDYSKTFLARLCEQAERYDGEFRQGKHNHEERLLTYSVHRDGHIHEGEIAGLVWSDDRISD